MQLQVFGSGTGQKILPITSGRVIFGSGTRGFEVRVRVQSGLGEYQMIGYISGSGLKKTSKPVGFPGSGKPDHALLVTPKNWSVLLGSCF